MARKVMCRKLQKELPGLDMAPFPGPTGEEIFNNISKEAWRLSRDTLQATKIRHDVVHYAKGVPKYAIILPRTKKR